MAYKQILPDDTGREHIIEIKDLNKSFDGTKVLKDITFYIRNNEFITLLGPSGCGKSTTLRIIAGFETADSGIVNFEGNSLLGVPAHRRNINTVFQRYALFPHLDVYDNVAFGLKIKKVGKKEINQRVMKALATVGLEDYGGRYVDQLSGGQMQRVAIARAIVNRPRVLLLDEPLGALDLKMRKEMQLELKAMQRELGITFVYVTHDQEEALTMSDTIIVMRDGVIQQIGTPIDVYNEPKNAYVADFIGESNIIAGKMTRDFEVTFSDGITFNCVDPLFPEFVPGQENEVDLVIRPEDFYVGEEQPGRINGTVESIVFKGVHYEIMVRSGNGIEWMVHNVDPVKIGQRVGLYVDPDDIQIMRRSELSPDFGSYGIKKPGISDDDTVSAEEAD
ncbi:MAG: ABC transporter ATP-binding protein [Saccharofermentans sp.]|jgi:spermidine/putrescine transport system ATP-binding protein|nr:ABC transporter ATP-binding protein [Mageeibacillus sp.]MCI1264840.1 ABC transporter ATP-binding protein [Saccharofermentans sp.]MCI1275691.1 ABC transporter ATP-binding protein [Saccharofermentans sp.]MCI1769900.1 ABC transporter ATP-binding protein [Mageeibacillus sp.]